MIEASRRKRAATRPVKRSPLFKDITGQKFGRVTVLEEIGNAEGSGRHILWKCICDCGKEITVDGTSIKSGKTKSCGCFRAEKLPTILRTHGHRAGREQSSEYTAWQSMRKRCEDVNSTSFKNYGGRGITVCERWQTFENFLTDMGERPSKKHSLDRFPNQTGNYEPGNVRWATMKQQQNNRTNNRLITAKGQTKTLQQWSEEIGMLHSGIQKRIKLGWTEERAVTTPSTRS